MAITWADVTARAPEASAASAETQAAILADVAAQVGANWGSLYTAGAAYLAAHLWKLSTMRGKGAQTAESVDRLSRSYAAPGAGDYGATSYGIEFQRLQRRLGLGLGLVP